MHSPNQKYKLRDIEHIYKADSKRESNITYFESSRQNGSGGIKVVKPIVSTNRDRVTEMRSSQDLSAT